MVLLVIVCTLMSVAALLFVFRPMLIGSGSPFVLDWDANSSSIKRLLRKKETIYENIKDLEFEYKMGKLSDEDYQRLHNEYLQEAYGVMKTIESTKPESLEKPGKPQVVAVLKSGKKSKN